MEKLFVLLFACLVNSEKRVLLHSATDLAQELVKLQSEFKTEMSALKTEISVLKTNISALEKENVALKTQLKTKTELGSVFVRWGRTTCPGNVTQMVYKGYTAGAIWNDKGGSPNMLCLPDHPTWGNYTDGLDGMKGYIYGVEIDMIEPSHVFSHAVNEQDQPCVVCHTSYAVTHMFPGRINCFPGWSLQYAGYLMSSWRQSEMDRDYICMDSDPGALVHGATNDNQGIVYLVEGRCGSLPCPPYVDGREIACAVCSK